MRALPGDDASALALKASPTLFHQCQLRVRLFSEVWAESTYGLILADIRWPGPYGRLSFVTAHKNPPDSQQSWRRRYCSHVSQSVVEVVEIQKRGGKFLDARARTLGDSLFVDRHRSYGQIGLILDSPIGNDVDDLLRLPRPENVRD